MTEETTLPPVKPTPKWKAALKQALAWCEQHPDWLLVFMLGFIAGAVLL